MSEVRLIDANALKELEPHYSEDGYRVFYEYEIDNAPTVEINDKSLEIARKSIELGRKVGKLEGKLERPQFRLQDEWLPISVFIPIEKGMYLTTTINHEVYCDYWNGENFDRTEAVIAWMPLPEGYKKGGDQ